MHVLRAEKGFIIVGQDTDGTVTPFDLGMDWIVSKAKGDFIGKRGLARPDLVAAGRRQLVGLLTENPAIVLEEGAQLVEPDLAIYRTPPMIGHVTSAYFSPVLGKSIALALVEGGHSTTRREAGRAEAGRPAARRHGHGPGLPRPGRDQAQWLRRRVIRRSAGRGAGLR